MALFPDMMFLKPGTHENSTIDNILCVGSYYADQIESVCGSRVIGRLMQFFSHREEFEDVKKDLILCCKNKRAGEVLPGDKTVPLFNSRAMMSLLQLLAFGRKHPEYFQRYPINIMVASKTLNLYLIEIQAPR